MPARACSTPPLPLYAPCFRRAAAALRLGRPDIAEADAARALERLPRHVRSRMRAAASAAALGKWQDAAGHYRLALMEAPGSSKAQVRT